MENYTRGSHTVYHYRYHLAWITKYRHRVLSGQVQIRTRELLARISEEMGVKIINGVLSKDHIHVFCSIPPHISVSDYMKKLKGKRSYKLQKEFPELRKKYCSRHFWDRGYFSTTSGNITDEIINDYIDKHMDANKPENIENLSLE